MRRDRRGCTARFRRGLLALAVAGLALGTSACENAPEEPAGPARPSRPPPARPTLTWSVPPSWTTQRLADAGMYRGKYTIPAAGDGKHEAELLIWTVTNESDLKGAVSELTGSFEGEGVAPREESFDGGAGTKVALTTVSGTYRFPMGPPMGKKGKRAAHVLKPEWRGAIAAVSAGDKGRWIFRIVGPEDTVRNAEGAFRALLLGLK